MARRFWGAKLTGDEGVDLPYNSLYGGEKWESWQGLSRGRCGTILITVRGSVGARV